MALLNAAQRMGLSINQDETKHMEAIERPTTQLHRIIDSHHIEVVKEFKYLSTTVTFNNNIRKVIKD
jgi:competence transcription factor ComK